MRISCTGCSRQLSIPDNKVPPRPFALTCPGCQTRIAVDPGAAAIREPERADLHGETQDGPATLDPEESAHALVSDLAELPELRGIDQQLMARLPPEAWVVDAGGGHSAALATALSLLGIPEVRQIPQIEEAARGLGESDVGVLLISLGKVEAPPSTQLQPIHDLLPEVRRRVFIAVVGDNVRSLDGQIAFLLRLNCLIASADLDKAPRLLRRALIHHLRLYRHWADAHQIA